jgi:uncharacterized protein (DUF1330 family)
MKNMLKTALVLAAGLVAGGGIVQGLHAQMKPPAFSVSVIDIKDDAGYKSALGDVRKRIADLGGKYLVSAGVAGGGEVAANGDKVPSRFVIIEWANWDAYSKWWKDAGEKDIKMLNQYTNSFKTYAAEGVGKQ